MKKVSAHILGTIRCIFVLLMIISPLKFFVKSAVAAESQTGYVRTDRMQVGTATGGEICLKPATTGTVTTVEVAFPAGDGSTTGYTVNTTPANWAVTTTNIDSGSTVWPSIATATTVSAQTVTFSMGAGSMLTLGTLYCFNFAGTSTLTSRATAASSLSGTITTKNAGTTVDTKTYALATITSDQITVSATVAPTITFSLSGTAATFSTALSSASVVSTNSITGTIGTNAPNGWVAYVKGAQNDGGTYSSLYSASQTARISRVAAATINNTPEDLASNVGYGLNVSFGDSATAGSGTVTQAAGYGAEYANGATTVGTLSATILNPIAAASGPTDVDTVVLTGRAKISALQAAAADYADTWTVVVAARF